MGDRDFSLARTKDALQLRSLSSHRPCCTRSPLVLHAEASVHMAHPPFGAVLDSLQKTQESARLMKVHRVSNPLIPGFYYTKYKYTSPFVATLQRQCLLLCTFVEDALTETDNATEEPVNSQQWDE